MNPPISEPTKADGHRPDQAESLPAADSQPGQQAGDQAYGEHAGHVAEHGGLRGFVVMSS